MANTHFIIFLILSDIKKNYNLDNSFVYYFQFTHKGIKKVIIEVSTEIILSILIPLTGTGVFVIRYFWKKEKCFTLMKQKIDELSKSESGSHDTHGNLYTQMNDQGNRITALEVKMDLLLDHFKIKSKK